MNSTVFMSWRAKNLQRSLIAAAFILEELHARMQAECTCG